MIKKTGLVILIIFSVLVMRVLYLQISHYLDGEEYLAQKDYKLAIREYDTSMHFYLPFSPYIERSAERLWAIGEHFEGKGKIDWALLAYSSIRSAFYSSRSLYTPGKEWIKRCDEKIASLNVKILLSEGSIKEVDSEEEKEKHLYVMRTDRSPEPLWAVILELGFFGWVGSVIYTIYRLDNRKNVLYGAVSFGVFFILWIFALFNA